MSVIIHGMEMPQRCIDCPVMDHDYGYCKIKEEGEADFANSRPDWCPLEELSFEAEVAQNVHNKYRCKCGGLYMPSNDIEKIEFVCQNCGAKMEG